jgi:ABC-type sugar transport system ATPase subunit
VAPGQVSAGHSASRGAPLLQIRRLSKSFGATRALDDVSLEVHSGEVLAVVGQNGSGKSTLVKVLAGVYPADPGGQIEVRDADGTRRNSRHSLHFIHQDLGLLPMLNTIENLDLGRPLGRRAFAPGNRQEEHRRASALVERYGAHIDVQAPVGHLSPAEKAIVAIARAMDGWDRPDNVLVLDEPTAAFHRDEVDRLFSAVRRVAADGAGVIFISHRLDEVSALADRVIALRDGKIVAHVMAGDFDQTMLVQAIVGTTVAETRRTAPPPDHPPTLRVEGLKGTLLGGLSFSVGRGEILGVSGVLGSGREELGALLFGADRRRGGTLSVGGVPLPPGDILAAMEQRVAFVPSDRRRHGAVMMMNVRENLTLPSLEGLRRRFGRIDRVAERRETRRWATAIGLRPLRPERPMNEFSGGNQQKVVLAKWLRTQPHLLVLEEPTQGVDVGAKASIYELVMQAATDGAAVVVSSSDTKELATICDRVLVLEDGRLVSELAGLALTEEALVRESIRPLADAEPAVDGHPVVGAPR